jgi:hypothetical protein
VPSVTLISLMASILRQYCTQTQEEKTQLDRYTSHQVKQRLLDTCEKWLRMSGCEVERTTLASGVVELRIVIPPDSADPHGDRLKLALDERKDPA